jgi:hypothetical protein
MTLTASRTAIASVLSSLDTSGKLAALEPTTIMPTSITEARARLRARFRFLIECFLLLIFSAMRGAVSGKPKALRRSW